jgi:uncharacterized membrane protein YjdF
MFVSWYGNRPEKAHPLAKETNMQTFRKSGIKNVDLFVSVNICMFVILCIFRYYSRFVHYRGAANITEFFVYAVAIISVILSLWSYFRRFNFETSLLVLLEIGILMHFFGAFIQIDGNRLYDAHFFCIRYDKYVHFANSFVISILVRKIFFMQKNKMDLISRMFILLIVLGLGAIVEIVEYGVTKTVPHNGVGDYDNNMQDLIANFAGGLCYLWMTSVNWFPEWMYHIVASDRIVSVNEYTVPLISDKQLETR